MEEINIEDYFLNLGWICINEIEKEVLLEILDLKVEKSISWKDGHELLMNSFDEKVFLNFKIENWEFIIGKYFFIENDSLKNVMNDLSEESKEVKSFAIDMWSSFYCYSKSINGKNIRFWIENDLEIINEGKMTEEELAISDNDNVNKMLQLAGETTIQFQAIEEYIKTNNVQILN